MKKLDFLNAMGSNKPTLELTPVSLSNDGISRLTFTGDDGKEYNFRGKNFVNALEAGYITEGDETFTVQRALLFNIDHWDAVRLSAPKTPDQVK